MSRTRASWVRTQHAAGRCGTTRTSSPLADRGAAHKRKPLLDLEGFRRAQSTRVGVEASSGAALICESSPKAHA